MYSDVSIRTSGPCPSECIAAAVALETHRGDIHRCIDGLACPRRVPKAETAEIQSKDASSARTATRRSALLGHILETVSPVQQPQGRILGMFIDALIVIDAQDTSLRLLQIKCSLRTRPSSAKTKTFP